MGEDLTIVSNTDFKDSLINEVTPVLKNQIWNFNIHIKVSQFNASWLIIQFYSFK